MGSNDSSHSLTISNASTSTATASAATTFSVSEQTVALSATVTSAIGIVNEGQETFTILSGNTVIGTAVSVNVTAGAANASYVLPAGTTTGTYTIQAVYDGTADYGSSMDSSQTLAVTAATTVTAAEGATAAFGDTSVTLSATITSPAGTVNQGTETFTIFNGTTPVGTAVTVNVAAGSASASYALPAGTPPDTYTIQAVYNGTVNFVGSTDASQTLVISAALASPDLQVQGLAVSPTTILSGDTVDVTWNDANTGDAAVDSAVRRSPDRRQYHDQRDAARHGYHLQPGPSRQLAHQPGRLVASVLLIYAPPELCGHRQSIVHSHDRCRQSDH